MQGDVKFIDGKLYYQEQDGKWYPVPLIGIGGGGRGIRGLTGPTGPTGPSGAGNVITDSSLQGNGSNANPLGLPYKLYVALLNQSGNNAPIATILENTLGFTPSYTYNSTGAYICNGTFPLGKTTISIASGGGSGSTSNSFEEGDATFFIIVTRNNNVTLGALEQANDLLLDTVIEIRVYP